jgi:hypothetical protein
MNRGIVDRFSSMDVGASVLFGHVAASFSFLLKT